MLGHQHKCKSTKYYELCVLDNYGRTHTIQSAGEDKLIKVDYQPENQEPARQFPHASKAVIKAFNRPHGQVQLLIGMASRSLHCKDGHETGELRLNRNIFLP